MKRTRLGVMTFVVLVFFGIAAAGAGSNHGARVAVVDDCNATFNANPPVGPGLGPGTCVKNGETSFQNFIAQLKAEGSADDWEFDPSRLKLRPGASISVRSEGGEFHTFSEVRNYGGGCVKFLNDILGLTAVPECQPVDAHGAPVIFGSTAVPAGGSLTVPGLTPGVHRFECLIHPWMRTTVTVGNNGRGGGDD
jgi:plastocyanin